AVAVIVCAAVSAGLRALARRARMRRIASYELSNREYKVTMKENSDAYSEVIARESDVTRRSYDTIDPCGRILFVVDAAEAPSGAGRAWPVVGNFPTEKFAPSYVERCEDSLKVLNTANEVRTTIEISLPDQDSTAEIWEITLENLSSKARKLKIVPYLEWVLNGGIHDRFHTQYSRLYPEMEYVRNLNTILSWQKATKSMGILASDTPPEGFQSARVDFIGRARSVWSPRILENLDFLAPGDTAGYPTFDPIGSLLVDAAVGAGASVKVRLMIGFAKNKEKALELVKKHLKPRAPSGAAPEKKKRPLLIGHGEVPAGTPQPYTSFSKDGNSLIVHTPYTPRPIDHAVSNA
ncbi:MAG: hypothetical protein L0213_11400, partial [Candidatus Dadabacteria bacterium]|nr:hypothetical protein [Candidatus Dadabacteria bacterium]